MKFTRAYHKQDFDGTQQTIGVDPFGQVWLITGLANESESGKSFAQFSPRDALRYAQMIAECATEGIRIQEQYVTISGYEQFPLRTEWGYNRYQALAEFTGVKQAMAQASREETEEFPCARCGKVIRLNVNGGPGRYGRNGE